MVLKRPPTAPAEPVDEKVRLAEEMVRKSIKINPDLKGGLSTTEVLQDLRAQARGQAVERAATGKVNTAAVTARATSAGKLSEERRTTVRFFLNQKAGSSKELAAELEERERQLVADRQALREQTIRELVDFLALLPDLLVTDEGREELRQCRTLFAHLGISEIDVTEAFKKKKG